jgi:hypothetical protein
MITEMKHTEQGYKDLSMQALDEITKNNEIDRHMFFYAIISFFVFYKINHFFCLSFWV